MPALQTFPIYMGCEILSGNISCSFFFYANVSLSYASINLYKRVKIGRNCRHKLGCAACVWDCPKALLGRQLLAQQLVVKYRLGSKFMHFSVAPHLTSFWKIELVMSIPFLAT